jgi:malate dehydrogenase (oxaloacetate-decarboxylating)
MDETEVFACEAADVAMAAVEEGVARVNLTRDEVFQKARADIAAARTLVDDMRRLGHIQEPPPELLEKALSDAIKTIKP